MLLNKPKAAIATTAANGTFCTIETQNLLQSASLEVHAPATVTAGTLQLQSLGEDGVYRNVNAVKTTFASAAVDTMVALTEVPARGLQVVLAAYAGSGNIVVILKGLEN